MATYIVGGARTSNKNLWAISDDGTSLTVSASYDIGAGEDIYAIVKDASGNYYVGTDGGKVYKVDSDFNAVAGWATGGTFDLGSVNYDVFGLAIDAQDYLAIAHYKIGASTTLTLLDDTGAVVWQKGLQGGATIFSGAVKFDAVGDIIASGSRATGAPTGYKYNRSDGTEADSFYAKAGAGKSYGCWVFQDGDIAIIQDLVTGAGNGTVRKCNFVDTQEFELTLNPGADPLCIAADGDENLYIGTQRNNAKSLYKVVVGGGSQSSYDTGAAVYSTAINPSGEIVAGGVSGTDSDSNVGVLRIFDTDLVLQRFTGDAALGSIRAVCSTSGAYGSSVTLWQPRNQEFTKTLTALGNNEVWILNSDGVMEELAAANNTINTSRPLDMFAADGKAFIVNEAIKKVVDFRNTKITTTDIAPAGKTAPSRGDTLVGQTSGAEMIVDLIDATDGAASIYGYRTTIATFANAETVQVGAGGTTQFTLNAAETAPPHYYDWITYGNDTSTYGELPAKATIAAWYFGRAVLSGNKNEPHQWYMSRIFNPWDFNYAASTDDELRAMAGGYEQAGKIPDIVIGIIPYKDDYCVFGSLTSCYYMIGNPAGGGEIFELKGTGGLLSKYSHVWDVNGNLYMLTTNGLLQIPPNFGLPKNLTAESWPEFITDLDYNEATDRLTMGYDQKRNGLLISNTTMADGDNSCWWYDLNTGSLFPEDYPDAMAIFSQYYSEDLGELIVGGFDGYMRHHDPTVKDDDGTTIDSYCGFGPIPLAQSPIGEGSIGPIDVILGGGSSTYADEVDSDDADYKVFVADTAAELIEKLVNASSETPVFAGTITGPGRRRGSKRTQSARGVYGGVRIGNSASGENFIFECLNIGSKPKGRSK